MIRPSLRLPLVILFAAGLVGAGWWLGRQDAASTTPQTGAVAVAVADASPVSATAAATGALPVAAPAGATAAASVAAPAAPLAAAALPLPPAGTNVAQIYDELVERAEQGDARAACRLASELQRCRFAAPVAGRLRDRRPGNWETRIAQIQDEAERERMIRFVAEAESRQDQMEQLCEGVTRRQIDQAFPLQMQAAAARPELRVRAALSPALDRMFPGSELERWQQYRPVAQAWLEQAAGEADLAAIIALARVHGDDRTGGPPVPPYRELDDARFVTYATLLERYGVTIPPVVRAAEEARARLEPDALRRAESRADALYRPGVTFDKEQREAAMRQSFANPNDAARCD